MTEAPSVRYLRDYVAIPSVNPMGRSDLEPSIVGEGRYAEHLRQKLRSIGLDAEIIGDPERPSVVAEASPVGAVQDSLLVESHLDTVPVDGMEIDPFDPVIKGGRLYGRGSCDTKAGMAALIDALERVLRAGTLRRRVIVSGASDEELGSIGARDLLAHLQDRMPRMPVWAIATEPTELRVVRAHKGIVIARIGARGVACHSSRPSEGRNAIVELARAILSLEGLAAKLSTRVDPELGGATLSVGVVHGGSAPNIVPDYAWTVLDRRLLPGEDAEQVRAELEGALEDSGADVTVESCRVEKGALGTPEDHPAVRTCQAALSRLGLPTETATASFGTDAGVFAEGGLPSIVIGPGSIEQAHTSREWVLVEQVEQMSEVFRTILEAPV